LSVESRAENRVVRPRIGLPGRWRLALGTVATAVAIWALVHFLDRGLFTDAARVLLRRPDLLAVFVGAYSAAFLLRAFAWRLLIPGSPGVGRLFSILQVSLLANHVFPAKVGEIARAALLARVQGRVGEAVVSTVLARLIDLLALLLIAAALGPLVLAAGIDRSLVVAGPLMLVLLTALGLVALRQGRLSRLPGRVGRLADDAREALRQIPMGGVLGAFGLSLVSWVLEASVLLIVADAAGVSISPPVAIAATALTIGLQAFQVTPGGIGVYEAGMSGALALAGIPPGTALALATLTHGLKFAYSYAFGIPCAAFEGLQDAGWRRLFGLRGTAVDVKAASRLEIVTARAWNVLNEGKTFTPVFAVGMVLLLNLTHLLQPEFWLRLLPALLVTAPLFLLFYRFDFPIRLRWALWVLLAVYVAGFRFIDPTAVAATLAVYLSFTVIFWGTIYYHLRLGAPWTNFTRFWKLVLENSDSTSGNFLEQVPKNLILIHLLLFLTSGPIVLGQAGMVLGYTALAGIVAVLAHQWWFTWRPALPVHPTRDVNQSGKRISRRFIVIVIDGCRRDVLLRANTPTYDRLCREGTEWSRMDTIYPARTVACFSSMFTGAPPSVHGMRSNFVPSLGVKCESLFGLLRSRGMLGRLIGIAHLIDPFGEEDVKTVTSVMDNTEIDLALIERAKRTLLADDPDLLILQLLSADQTGHSRGSYYPEYQRQVEITDGLIGEFLSWLEERRYLEDATVVLMADHGQSRGIGGHGHIDTGESPVPFVMWGAGVPAGCRIDERRAVLDLGPTISYFLGLPPTGSSVGRTLLTPGQASTERPDLVAVLIPVHDEAGRLADVIREVPRSPLGLEARVIVVDDGSIDGSAAEAREAGADVVVRHPSNRGLGAALRTGLATAHQMGAEYVVYLDGDGEYDPTDLPALLEPLMRGQADYVIGSRFLNGVPRGMRLERRVGNAGFSFLTSLLAGHWINDGQSGFRAFNRRAIEVAEIVHDYNYAQVLTLDLLKKGMRLTEVPIHYTARRTGRSFVRYHTYVRRVVPAIAREVLQA
jgi:uncharacterized membrane protein YbhN (UPF0104 family)